MNLFTKQTHRYRELTCGCQGWGGRVMEEESVVRRGKLLYIKWVNNTLLYSPENYIQYSAISHNGKEY